MGVGLGLGWGGGGPWSESPAELGTRLQTICQDINKNCDVDALCRRFPQRVQMVVDAEGDRINK